MIYLFEADMEKWEGVIVTFNVKPITNKQTLSKA